MSSDPVLWYNHVQDPATSGRPFWDIMLTRCLRSEQSPLYWKRSGACCVVPCVGSWVGHGSGSSDFNRYEPHGFEKTHFHGQAGTRRWRNKLPGKQPKHGRRRHL